MSTILDSRGFEIETVLLKGIQLPAGLANSVKAKLSAEQDAARMTFVLMGERQEAERKRIQAAGMRDSQDIVATSLSGQVIRWKAVEAFRELALAPNAKVIVTSGASPIMIESD